MFSTIDLHKVLVQVQDSTPVQTNTKSFKKSNQNYNQFDFDQLETNRIFHRDAIKKICIDYRLRFLDLSYFKADVPVEAIHKIQALEKDHKTEVKHMKIVAPSKLFKLKNADDPLLFVPIGNDYYYLIHKWGNDLHPLRLLMMWPFKNIVTSILSILLLSFLLTAMMPLGLFSSQPNSSDFLLIFLFMFKSIAAIVIYYAFAAGKNFNRAIWDSSYYN
ncbi:MAG: hypothetical protein VX027_04910 [Bacteroidota bacterium]|nr:hypothetical protein [Bacteroidota bacterium]MEC8239434.1 hypothetical protein [Bacteroidota bacterium]